MNRAFKALSDPTRRQILFLLKSGDLSAGEIGENFAMTAASVSHHLKELTTARLVLRERQGQKIIYSLNTTVFEEVLTWFYQITGKDSFPVRRQ